MSVAGPSTGAKGQVARLLALIPFLHAREEVRLDEAAAALGVAPGQLLTDLRVLLMCGLPGGYPDDLIDVDLDALTEQDGDGVIRVSNADYLARPLRLTPTEATAIIVALRALRDGSSEETREVVDRALTKLEAAAADGTAAARIELGQSDAEVAALEARLQDAVDRQRQIDLTYYVPSRDEVSERRVDPRGVVRSGGVAYLDAWCHSAEAPRLFRLDRISEARVLDEPIRTDPEEPRDLSDGIFASSEGTTTVTLRLQPPARWVVEYYPVLRVRRRRGGVVEVDLQVADVRWLTRLMMRLSPHAAVLSPPEIAEAHLACVDATLELYPGGAR